jgi:CO/xanthine dehydrogenase FAD-binding subunit
VVSVPLAGGTALNGLPTEIPEEVVDLQALDLSDISRDGPTLEVGSMTTLRDFVDHEWTPPLLRDLALREAPNTIRNAATIGGTVATADPESGLLSGFLAHAATLRITRAAGTEEVTLAHFLEGDSPLDSGLITSVRIPLGGKGAFEATARTPADIPIVLMVGHRSDEGELRVAAAGVASHPVLIDLDRIADLDPPGDFRGSADYRRHLVTVLAARVVGRLPEGAVS